MEKVLQSHWLGPHRVDVVELADDEGGGLVTILIDDVVVTDPPLEAVPTTDELMRIYARWQAARQG